MKQKADSLKKINKIDSINIFFIDKSQHDKLHTDSEKWSKFYIQRWWEILIEFLNSIHIGLKKSHSCFECHEINTCNPDLCSLHFFCMFQIRCLPFVMRIPQNLTIWSSLILICVLVCKWIIVISCTFLKINCIRIYVSASRNSE
jgi:hypothetical protein